MPLELGHAGTALFLAPLICRREYANIIVMPAARHDGLGAAGGKMPHGLRRAAEYTLKMLIPPQPTGFLAAYRPSYGAGDMLPRHDGSATPIVGRSFLEFITRALQLY